MPETPTVSIVIPCYNAARWIRETLESAVQQTFPPLEVIVVDDGSTDDSASIAESFGAPVRVIRQTNQGESVARNRGISEAKGDYLYFLDADDWVHPEAFARLAAAVVSKPRALAIMGCAWFESEPERPYREALPSASDFFPAIIQSNLAPIHCWLVPREAVLSAGGFRDDLQIYEDWNLWCRVALSGVRLFTVPFVGAYYRRHANSQLAQAALPRVARGHVAIMQDLCDGILAQRELLAEHGMTLFWSTWTALNRGRSTGMSWHELKRLSTALERIVREGPDDVRRLKYARLIALFGVRWAEMLRNLVVPRRQAATDIHPISAATATL